MLVTVSVVKQVNEALELRRIIRDLHNKQGVGEAMENIRRQIEVRSMEIGQQILHACIKREVQRIVVLTVTTPETNS